MLWLSADGDTPSFAAARVKLHSRATSTNLSKSSTLRRDIDEPCSLVHAPYSS
jgi:hypothetical protein